MAAKKHKIRLGVMFGGKSGEHEVSLASAAAVIGGLDPEEYEVIAIGITKSGTIASASEVRTMLPATLLQRVSPWVGEEGGNTPDLKSSLLGHDGRGDRRPDIIFPVLHGPFGEDGTIQGLLEIAGIPYVGCGVLASAVGMDKDFMKRLFLHAGLPVVPYFVESSRGLKQRLAQIRSAAESRFGYPVFSKPANLGSSVGVFKIHDAGEFDQAVLASARFDRKVVVEKGIDARELECAVLGNEEPEASVVGEIIPACEFYDYTAKYRNPDSRAQIPADIAPETAREIRDLSLRAFRAIEGSGLARVDFFLDRNTGTVWLNEINTMPGFTSISMYPKLWAACGAPFADLIRRLIDLGFERHRQREGLTAVLPDGRDGGGMAV